MSKYYIAYGSNMDLKQMALRCPRGKVIGVAEIKDYELLFRGSFTGAYATIEPKKGSTVPVLVWRIAKTDEERLDIYEGFPRFYYKQEFTVSVNGEKYKAMAYLMDPRRPFGRPSTVYLDCLSDAYDRLGFKKSILDAAVKKSDEEGQLVEMRKEHPNVPDFQLLDWIRDPETLEDD